MYMRLASAVATEVDPDILVIDEILAVGDASFKEKCYDRLRSFRERGKTIVIVSHDAGMIAGFCDRVLLINKGEHTSELQSQSNLVCRLLLEKKKNKKCKHM